MSTHSNTASHRWLSVMIVAACIAFLWEGLRKLLGNGEEDPKMPAGQMRREPPEDYQTPSAFDPDFCTTPTWRGARMDDAFGPDPSPGRILT